MFLSAAECFIVGRIAAAWPVECRKFEAMKKHGRIQESLLRVIDRVFDEFCLERSMPPKEWWDRQDDMPSDVVWRKAAERERPSEFMSTDEGFPGTPCVAMGVSPSEPGTLFVERCDGRICGWRIDPPRMGLYGLLLRRLRPIMGLSAQTWLMLHEGPWRQVIDGWRQLPDFDDVEPHTPFMADPPGDVIETLAAVAAEAGQAAAFDLGQACGTVDNELWRFAEMAGCWPLIWTTLRRVREPGPEDTIPALLGASQVFQRPEAEAAARADHLVAAVYRDAARELAEYAGDVSELLMITMGIMLAHSRTSQASMYLYGKLHGSAL